MSRCVEFFPYTTVFAQVWNRPSGSVARGGPNQISDACCRIVQKLTPTRWPMPVGQSCNQPIEENNQTSGGLRMRIPADFDRYKSDGRVIECTPSFRDTPWIVPTPNSCSRRISSNNSTFDLLDTRSLRSNFKKSSDEKSRSAPPGRPRGDAPWRRAGCPPSLPRRSP